MGIACLRSSGAICRRQLVLRVAGRLAAADAERVEITLLRALGATQALDLTPERT